MSGGGGQLSVLIPTLAGREGVLGETVGGYRATAPGCKILTVEGRSWGAGLNELTAMTDSEWLLFAPDDALPHPGWLEAAMGFWSRGWFPAARYLDLEGEPCHGQDGLADGEPVTWTRLFLLRRELFERLGPMIDATWWADIEYSERIVDAGFSCHSCGGFVFTHLDGDRSWLTEAEETRQRLVYEARVREKSVA